MSWNGSNANDNAQEVRSAKPIKPAKPNASRGILAGVIVVVLAAAVWFFCFNDKEVAKPEKEQPVPKQIVEVKPSIPKAKPAEPAKPKIDPNARPTRIGETLNGYRLLPSGRLHKVKGVITTGVERVTLVDKTFDHGSDRMIAHMLMAEPGGAMLLDDSAAYFRNFDEQFEKSLKDRIEVLSDDTDEVKTLKKAVNDAREEILKLKAQGKSPAEVMTETREQLCELMLYREDLEKEVLRLSEDGMSQEDYDELIGAANKMLEERGSKPIELPGLVGDALDLKFSRREAELKQQIKDLEKKIKENE